MKNIYIGTLGLAVLFLSSCGEVNNSITKTYTIDASYNEDSKELSDSAEICDEDLGILVARNTFSSTVELTVTTTFSYTKYGGPYDGMTVSLTSTSQGTGFFINEDGYLLTNAHVVKTGYESYPGYMEQSKKMYLSYADSSVEIEFNIVDVSNTQDLALLKADNIENVCYLPFYKLTDPKSEEYNTKDATKLYYGETVFVVGNARGYGIAITRGVISAPIRYFGSSSSISAIQTDAAINSGNSGGPLVNKYSCVIGINSFKLADEEIEGMGFAIPSNVILDYIDSVSSDINYYYTTDRSYNPNIQSRI